MHVGNKCQNHVLGKFKFKKLYLGKEFTNSSTHCVGIIDTLSAIVYGGKDSTLNATVEKRFIPLVPLLRNDWYSNKSY